jgi:hypothetical protein
MLLGAIAASLGIWITRVMITICYLVIRNQKGLGEFGIYKEWSSGGVFGRAPVDISVELQSNVRWSSGGRSRKRAK